MLAIDYTPEVAREAAAAACDVVIAYHPPIFQAVKRVTAGGPSDLVYDAIRRGVAIYSPHTALDVADGGTNDVLADVLGLTGPLAAQARRRDQGQPVQAGDVRAGAGGRDGQRGAVRRRRGADRELHVVQLPLAGDRHILRRGRDEPHGRPERPTGNGARGAGRDGRADRADRSGHPRPAAGPPLRGARVRPEPARDPAGGRRHRPVRDAGRARRTGRTVRADQTRPARSATCWSPGRRRAS